MNEADRRKKDRTPSADGIEAALKFMKGAGLVPTGTGKPTKPSSMPPFTVVYDKAEETYFLVADYGNHGDIWEIKENGDSEHIGSFEGKFSPGEGQDEYDEGEFADYVPLEVIQAVYSTLDPEFDKPREGEPPEDPTSQMNNGVDKFGIPLTERNVANTADIEKFVKSIGTEKPEIRKWLDSNLRKFLINDWEDATEITDPEQMKGGPTGGAPDWVKKSLEKGEKVYLVYTNKDISVQRD